MTDNTADYFVKPNTLKTNKVKLPTYKSYVRPGIASSDSPLVHNNEAITYS